MTFVPGPVTVTVPATSANLGPGYDCLGLALELRDELTAEVVGGDRLEIQVVGEAADEVPRDPSHLVVRAMDAAFGAIGVRTPGVRLSCTNRIPHARGLGSSSAAIVGGIALARALVEDGSERLDLGGCLALATALEGHADNVGAALFGGLVVCGEDDEDVWADQAPLDPRVRVGVFVPPTGLSTELARGLLPETVPHAQAAANSGRAALLVAALGSAPDRLLRATEDFLHQAYRRPAMPDSLDLVDRLRADGHAAVVSGAGPAVLVLTAAAPDLAAYNPEGWRHLELQVAREGVRIC
ncbi:MAG TPA: homoserine kinase [Nocardioides sp.]|nr:homoserine kinase [Nocardioides sp.]